MCISIVGRLRYRIMLSTRHDGDIKMHAWDWFDSHPLEKSKQTGYAGCVDLGRVEPGRGYSISPPVAWGDKCMPRPCSSVNPPLPFVHPPLSLG